MLENTWNNFKESKLAEHTSEKSVFLSPFIIGFTLRDHFKEIASDFYMWKHCTFLW